METVPRRLEAQGQVVVESGQEAAGGDFACAVKATYRRSACKFINIKHKVLFPSFSPSKLAKSRSAARGPTLSGAPNRLQRPSSAPNKPKHKAAVGGKGAAVGPTSPNKRARF